MRITTEGLLDVNGVSARRAEGTHLLGSREMIKFTSGRSVESAEIESDLPVHVRERIREPEESMATVATHKYANIAADLVYHCVLYTTIVSLLLETRKCVSSIQKVIFIFTKKSKEKEK